MPICYGGGVKTVEQAQKIFGLGIEKIALSSSVINDPKLILADEPTGNLDPQTSMEVMEVLLDLNKKGHTIFMATHDYALILKYPSKTLKCEDAKVFEVVQRKN